MATNGFVHSRGYRTTATPDWVDALLVGSNDVRDAMAWTDGGETILAVTTAADVVVINKDQSVRVGYAARAGGFVAIAKAGGDERLFLGTASEGVFCLDLTGLDMQTAHGDLTPSPWTATLTTATDPAIYANSIRDVFAWISSSVGAHVYLAVTCEATLAECARGIATIVDVSAGTAVNSSTARLVDVDQVHGVGRRLYFLSGNFVNALYDAEGAAADFVFDATTVGTVADDFTDGALAGWTTAHNAPGGTATVSESDGAMHVVLRDGGSAADVWASRTCLLLGDFNVQARFEVAWTTKGDNETEKLCLGCWPLAEGSSSALYVERWNHDVGGSDLDQLRWKKGWEGAFSQTPYSETDFCLRIQREGSTWSLYYGTSPNDAGAWLATYTDMPTGPVAMELYAYQYGGDDDFNIDVTDIEAGGYAAGTVHNTLPAKAITDVAVAAETSSSDSSTVFVACDGEVYAVDTDEYPAGEAEPDGAVYAISAGETVYEKLACTSDAAWPGGQGAGYVMASHDGGIDHYDLDSVLAPGVEFTFSMTGGYPMVDHDTAVIASVEGGEAFVYGTDDGAGWIEPDRLPPDDTDVEVWEDGTDVWLGWRVPDDLDYDHTTVARRKNGGDWASLGESGWGAGAAVVFDENHDGLHDHLTSLELGKYEFLVQHADETGNFSEGTIVPALVDHPHVTSVTINDGASTTSANGVSVTVSCHSGAASGAESDQAHYVQFREPGQLWGAKRRFAADAAYDVCLGSELGSHTVEARVFSRGELVSDNTGSDTITLVAPDEAPDSAPAEDEEKFILAGPFRSDDGDVDWSAQRVYLSSVADVEDTLFPLSNLQDVRLGVKTVLPTPLLAGEEVRVTANLGTQFRAPCFVAIAGHNLNGLDTDFYDVKILESMDGETWGDGFNINALLGQPTIVLDVRSSPVNTTRYVRLSISVKHSPVPYYPLQLQLGRLIVATRADYLQPSINFDQDLEFGPQRDGIVHKTPGARYVANGGHRMVARLRLSHFDEDGFLAVTERYLEQGASRPFLLLLRPSRIPCAQAVVTTEYDGVMRNQALYAWVDDDQLLWRWAAGEVTSASLTFSEAIEE